MLPTDKAKLSVKKAEEKKHCFFFGMVYSNDTPLRNVAFLLWKRFHK